MTNSTRRDGPAVDPRHLLVIGAGPGLGGGIAHRFAQGGYHLTLLAVGSARISQVAGKASAAIGTATRNTVWIDSA
jgi:NAD(P)-dependent dehydrogenase (short-subunit alcohol dehydrogenase family)